MSSADKLLSTLTGSEKTSLSKTLYLSKYGQPREYFNIPKKILGCQDEIADQKIKIEECVNAREYCDKVMFRYITLLDNATFMPSEHIQKEKEYGITWRTAFKNELNTLVSKVSQKLISEDGKSQEDPFALIH